MTAVSHQMLLSVRLSVRMKKTVAAPFSHSTQAQAIVICYTAVEVFLNAKTAYLVRQNHPFLNVHGHPHQPPCTSIRQQEE